MQGCAKLVVGMWKCREEEELACERFSIIMKEKERGMQCEKNCKECIK